MEKETLLTCELTLILLVGIPASGKSHLALLLHDQLNCIESHNAVIVNFDKFEEEQRS